MVALKILGFSVIINYMFKITSATKSDLRACEWLGKFAEKEFIKLLNVKRFRDLKI